VIGLGAAASGFVIGHFFHVGKSVVPRTTSSSYKGHSGSMVKRARIVTVEPCCTDLDYAINAGGTRPESRSTTPLPRPTAWRRGGVCDTALHR
jgi:hypothetical protein